MLKKKIAQELTIISIVLMMINPMGVNLEIKSNSKTELPSYDIDDFSTNLSTSTTASPIDIDGNAELITYCNLYGSGGPGDSWSDPYIIENKEISGSSVAISIMNTDKYLIIQGCDIMNTGLNNGMELINCENVKVLDNYFVNIDGEGVNMESSTQITFYWNLFKVSAGNYGIKLDSQCSYNSIKWNNFLGLEDPLAYDDGQTNEWLYNYWENYHQLVDCNELYGSYYIDPYPIDSSSGPNAIGYDSEYCPTFFDSDIDFLPDRYEIKYGFDPYDPYDPSGGGSGDYDGDGILNYKEFRFDMATMKMDPTTGQSDTDGISDTMEYYLYWQYSAGYQDYDGNPMNPIVNNLGIQFTRTDATSAVSNYPLTNAVYPTGSGQSFLDSSKIEDSVYGWFYAIGPASLNVYWQGYSSPPCWDNATIRGLLREIYISYRVMPYATNRANLPLSNFYMKVTSGTVDSNFYYYYDIQGGQLPYSCKNVFADGWFLMPSNITNSVKAGNKIDRIRSYLNVGSYWWQSGQICTDYLAICYLFY